jgi:hypothetical protein
MQWLGRHERFWAGSLDRLAAHAEHEERAAKSRQR